MFTYSLTYKSVPSSQIYLNQLQALNPNITTIELNTTEETLTVVSSTEIYGGELASLDLVAPGSTPIQLLVEQSISAAMTFGHNLVVTFAAENVLLGVTQAGKTSVVRDATAMVVNALTTGSLYDAIAEAKAIPAGSKDATFVTDARLLGFINKIEAYLGIPLSETL